MPSRSLLPLFLSLDLFCLSLLYTATLFLTLAAKRFTFLCACILDLPLQEGGFRHDSFSSSSLSLFSSVTLLLQCGFQHTSTLLLPRAAKRLTFLCAHLILPWLFLRYSIFDAGQSSMVAMSVLRSGAALENPLSDPSIKDTATSLVRLLIHHRASVGQLLGLTDDEVQTLQGSNPRPSEEIQEAMAKILGRGLAGQCGSPLFFSSLSDRYSLHTHHFHRPMLFAALLSLPPLPPHSLSFFGFLFSFFMLFPSFSMLCCAVFMWTVSSQFHTLHSFAFPHSHVQHKHSLLRCPAKLLQLHLHYCLPMVWLCCFCVAILLISVTHLFCFAVFSLLDSYSLFGFSFFSLSWFISWLTCWQAARALRHRLFVSSPFAPIRRMAMRK